MSIAEIHQLPLNEKLQIMEAIWEDLCAKADSIPVPDWHKDLLDARRDGVESGQEAVVDCRRDPAWIRKHLGKT